MKNRPYSQFCFLAMFVFGLTLVSCTEDEPAPEQLAVPDTYEFVRNQQSTVDYSGQAARLDMLSAIKSYLVLADGGQEISADQLNDMYANANDPFEDATLNASGKQLEDKTFAPHISNFKDMFEQMAAISSDVAVNQTQAAAGQAGLLERGNTGNTILVNEKGWEYTQFIEKGLMGSVFFHQIFNVYLSADRMGSEVNNSDLVDDKNYTLKEHYFDEAFGYWGVPTDFPSELPSSHRRFWASYTYGRNAATQSLGKLKSAFLIGRTAIVNNDQATLDQSITIILEELEMVAVATAIHYLNDASENYNAADIGNMFHHLSEAYVFMQSLRVHPSSQIPAEDLTELLDNGFGVDQDFWTVTPADIEALKTSLITYYPTLASIADQL